MRSDHRDVTRHHIGNDLELSRILPYATDSNPDALTAGAVVNEDVGRISFCGDAVVTIGDIPAAKGDIVSVKGIGAVGIDDGGSRGGGAVDVDVLQEDVGRVLDRHGPVKK